MNLFSRETINNILRIAPRQSYRILRHTSTGRIRSDAVLDLLNNARVGIITPLSVLPFDLITPDEVERVYGVTKKELSRWGKRKRNAPPHFRLNKHTVRYSQSSFGKWLKDNSI